MYACKTKRNNDPVISLERFFIDFVTQKIYDALRRI